METLRVPRTQDARARGECEQQVGTMEEAPQREFDEEAAAPSELQVQGAELEEQVMSWSTTFSAIASPMWRCQQCGLRSLGANQMRV